MQYMQAESELPELCLQLLKCDTSNFFKRKISSKYLSSVRLKCSLQNGGRTRQIFCCGIELIKSIMEVDVFSVQNEGKALWKKLAGILALLIRFACTGRRC
jgi:hypothetical protein